MLYHRPVWCEILGARPNLSSCFICLLSSTIKITFFNTINMGLLFYSGYAYNMLIIEMHKYRHCCFGNLPGQKTVGVYWLYLSIERSGGHLFASL